MERKQKLVMKHQRKKKILKLLQDNPIISSACIQVDISRQTFYRWREEDLDFDTQVHKMMEIGIDAVNDLAESSLISNIQGGLMRAICYWLSNNHRNYILPRRVIDNNRSRERIMDNTIIFKDFSGKK